jgi:hypothetical protein
MTESGRPRFSRRRLMSATAMSGAGIALGGVFAQGSSPAAFPDFTRGEWRSRKPAGITGA